MGCIYFVKHKGLDPIKIGMSNYNNPFHRIGDMETASPFGIELLGFVKTDNPLKLEKKYHSKFSSSRIKGEWFSIPIEQVYSILEYHNGKNVISQLASFIEELQISPREALELIAKKRKVFDFDTDVHGIFMNSYSTLVETTNSSWVSKKELIDQYSKKARLSRAQAYRHFKKIENNFLSCSENRKKVIKAKEME